MNRIAWVGLLALLFPVSCTGQYYSDAVIARDEESKPVPRFSEADSLFLEQDHTEIAWKGTKMWGRGMHTGVVPLKEGYLLWDSGRLIGGTVTADMTSIGITDIPPDQPEPINILTGHLEDAVFFDVATYPEAEFTVTDVEYLADTLLNISGNLTIRELSRNITVPASVDSTDGRFTTRFRINRFNWNIAYRGGFGATRFAARNFVDKYIELTISIDTEL